MTPKQKCDELFEIHLAIINGGERFGWNNEVAAKQKAAAIKCALFTAIEVTTIFGMLHKPEYVTFLEKNIGDEWMNGYEMKDFYEEVKRELEKL
jgi:hypothetical protein